MLSTRKALKKVSVVGTVFWILIGANSGHSIDFNCDTLIKNYSELLSESILESDSLNFDNRRNRDPLGAFVIAAGPGLFVHGVGHFYIGENKIGAGLLAAEIISLPLLYVAAAHEMAESEGGSTISSDMALASGLSSAVLFIGSYLIDVIHAPAKANDNKRRYEYYHP